MKKLLNIFSKSKPSKNKILKTKILIDHREKNSLVPTLLKENFQVEFKQLPVADYVIGNIAIERKTISDFKSSIVNKRIMRQLLELKQYPQYFLILEGFDSQDIYNTPGIHENAMRGFLLSVALEYKVPIIFTFNEKDTARYLEVLAKKKNKQTSSTRASKIHLTKMEQQYFVLEGFPNIGLTKAKKLLEEFKTLENIFNASEEELEPILGSRSKEFKDLLHHISQLKR